MVFHMDIDWVLLLTVFVVGIVSGMNLFWLYFWGGPKQNILPQILFYDYILRAVSFLFSSLFLSYQSLWGFMEFREDARLSRFSSVMSNSLWSHGLQHARLPCPSPTRLLKLRSIKSVMPSSYLILCCPLLLLPSVFPSIRLSTFFWNYLLDVLVIKVFVHWKEVRNHRIKKK